MTQEVFTFSHYKPYLSERLPTQGSHRGARSRLAERLRCKPAFITQVLNGEAHFSLEHAIEIDRFLQHSSDETRYFMLLVYKDRAGSRALEEFYSEQLELLRRERNQISSRVVASKLKKESTHRYYASWIYSAIHVLVLVPGMGSEEKIAERLGISHAAAKEAVEFLLSIGMIERKNGELVTTARRLHLKDDSTMIQKHHSNWRIRALHSLDSKNPLDLHYSGPLALSRKNAEKIRAILLEQIAKFEPVVAEPGEEEIYGIALDFFTL